MVLAHWGHFQITTALPQKQEKSSRALFTGTPPLTWPLMPRRRSSYEALSRAILPEQTDIMIAGANRGMII